MSIWLLIWLLISAALLGFLFWTILILVRQQAVWKKYAAKHKLRFKPNSFFEVPEIAGLMGEHAINAFSGEHMGPDARFSRKMTAIEIQLASKMPVNGGIASAGMVDLVQGMGFKEEYSPRHAKWEDSYMAAAASRNVLEIYLNETRLNALTDLMAIKNAWVILVFKGDVTLLRIDTPDPLCTEKTLDMMAQKMLATAKVLELEKGEAGLLKEAATKKPKNEVSLEVNEDKLENTGLQLEDDEPEAKPKPKAKSKKAAPKKKSAPKAKKSNNEASE